MLRYNPLVSLDVAQLDQGGRLVSNCLADAVPSAHELEQKGTRWVNACSEDLLGLGHDPRVREAALAAQRKLGNQRLVTASQLREVETRFAALAGHEAALVAADWRSVIRCLPTWRCAADARSRALAPDATAVMTPDDAEAMFGGGSLAGLLVEAVHAHEGDLAPLPRYAEVCARTGVSLVVVDGLGAGLLGANGGGAVEHFAVKDDVALQVLAVGGALPGQGVVVTGQAVLINALRGQCEPAVTAPWLATLRAVELNTAEPQRRARVFEVAHRIVSSLRAHGFDTGPCVTPWIPVWIGDAALCGQWLDGLAEAGIAARAWLAPGSSRLLLSFAATTPEAMLDQVLETFDRLARRMKPRELAHEFPEPPVIARPGTFTIAHPCSAHWLTQVPASRPHHSEPAPAALRERVFDVVENLTWRASVASSRSIKRGTDAVRALLDKRRKPE